MGPLPAGAGYQITVSSVRGVPGLATESLVHGITRTPAAYGPASRGSRQVPAVHVTTSLHEVSSLHDVRSARLESLQDLDSRQVGGSGLLRSTLPHGAFVPPHAVPLAVCLAVLSHSCRSWLPASAALSTFLAQRCQLLRLVAAAQGHVASVVDWSAASAR